MFENIFWFIVFFLAVSFILGFMSYGLVDMNKNTEKLEEKPKEKAEEAIASPAS